MTTDSLLTDRIYQATWTPIAYWCDDEWCYLPDLKAKLKHKTGDYLFVSIPNGIDIDAFVRGLNAGRFSK